MMPCMTTHSVASFDYDVTYDNAGISGFVPNLTTASGRACHIIKASLQIHLLLQCFHVIFFVKDFSFNIVNKGIKSYRKTKNATLEGYASQFEYKL